MADYDAGCRVISTSTKCRMRKSRTSSSPLISRRGNASASRRRSRRSSKNLAKTCKSASHRPLHLAPESTRSPAATVEDQSDEVGIYCPLQVYCHTTLLVRVSRVIVNAVLL